MTVIATNCDSAGNVTEIVRLPSGEIVQRAASREALPRSTSRTLSPTPDWLTGVVVRFVGMQDPTCRKCGEILCLIDQGESLWILADVARDHRKFCRDQEERNP